MTKLRLTSVYIALTTLLLTSSAYAFPRDGIYIGAGVGETFNHYSLSARNQQTGFSVSRSSSHNNVIGNAFLGYGYTAMNSFYVGLEFGTNFPSRTDKIKRPGVVISPFEYTDHLHVQDYLTGDLLPGYRIGKNWLIYARGGFSYAHFHFHQDANSAAGTPSFNHSENNWGWRAGVGVNRQLTKYLSLGLDYFYSAYQKMHTTWQLYDIRFKESVHTNYIGLSLICNFPLRQKCKPKRSPTMKE